MTHSLSEGENALVGITAGIADITCIQWAYYLKNARQQRLPLTLNPRILYRGYVANCANVAAGTSFQFTTAGALNKLVLRGAQRELTDVEKVGTGLAKSQRMQIVLCLLAPKTNCQCLQHLTTLLFAWLCLVVPGFLAGFASGVVASPAELVMTQQQLKGGSVLQNVRAFSELEVFDKSPELIQSDSVNLWTDLVSGLEIWQIWEIWNYIRTRYLFSGDKSVADGTFDRV